MLQTRTNRLITGVRWPLRFTAIGCLALIMPNAAPAQFDFFPGGFNGGFNGEGTPAFQPIVLSTQDILRTNTNAALQQRDWVKAEDLASKLIATNPQDHDALFMRSAARVQQGIAAKDNKIVRAAVGDASAAVATLKTLGLGAKMEYYIPYLYGMTNLGALEKNPELVKNSQDFVNKMLAKPGLTNVEKANFLYQRCLTYVQFEKYEEAIADLEEGLKLVPDHYGIFMGLVDIYKHKKTPDEVATIFDRAAKAMPTNPVIYNNRGLYMQSVSRIPEAITDLNKAIELDPKFEMAYRNRGFTLFHAGRVAEAEVDLSKSIDLKSGETVPLALRGHCRIQQAKLDLAMQDYQKVVELVPKSTEAYRDLAFVQFFSGKYEDSIKSFDKVAELDPKATYVAPWRYAASLQLPKDPKAVPAESSKVPEHREWHDSLLMFLKGQLDEAGLLNSITHDEKVVTDKQTCEAYYFIGLERLRQNKSEEAKAFFEQAVQIPYPQLSAYRGANIALKQFPAATK